MASSIKQSRYQLEASKQEEYVLTLLDILKDQERTWMYTNVIKSAPDQEQKMYFVTRAYELILTMKDNMNKKERLAVKEVFNNIQVQQQRTEQQHLEDEKEADLLLEMID